MHTNCCELTAHTTHKVLKLDACLCYHLAIRVGCQGSGRSEGRAQVGVKRKFEKLALTHTPDLN